MNILCTGNIKKRNFFTLLDQINNKLLDSKHTLFLDKSLLKKKIKVKYKLDKIYKPKNNIDFVISLGGDGSILSAVSRMNDKQIPILGVHIGELGFLNQSTKDNYLVKIKHLLTLKKINFDKKHLINAKISNENKLLYTMNALNDFSINQKRYSRILKMEVFVNNEPLNKYNCDGLIVATPLGSTAYSLSAGGPIVSQNVKGLIITPVSPHSLSARPIVVADNSKIMIKFPRLQNIVGISADGQKYKSLDSKSLIEISKSKVFAKLIKLPKDDSFYIKLRKKLRWFGDHRN